MSSFTVDAARARARSDADRDRRAAAAEQAASDGLPSTDEEIWRYSRVAELDLDEWTLAPPVTEGEAPVVPPPIEAALANVPERAATVVLVNGRLVPPAADDAGVVVLDGAAAAERVGAVMDEPTDVFARMNDAYAGAPVVVSVPAGRRLDAPIVVACWSDEAGVATFPRLVVELGEGAEATVVEYHASAAGTPTFAAPVTELDLARAARLGYVGVQNLGPASWQMATQISRVGTDATLVSASAAFGGDYTRLRTDCRLAGRGATGRLLAIYFGEDEQTLDFRTFQDHAAPDTTSELLFKGAVGGNSRSVYTGLIRVRKNARGTNAIQTNRNIKLSEGAWAESIPNLEIENNDVRCSHASAVGPVDEDQRFYLESRGVPTAAAERLVVTGFFDQVLEQLPVPETAGALRGLIDAKLARMDADG